MHRRLDDILQHRHVRPEIEALEYEAERRADAIDLGKICRPALSTPHSHADGLAANGDLAGIRDRQQWDAAQQGALAGTTRADDADDVALFGVKRYAFQYLKLPKRLCRSVTVTAAVTSPRSAVAD